jgi:hypothetical protein
MASQSRIDEETAYVDNRKFNSAGLSSETN